ITCGQPAGEVGSGARAAVPRTGPDAMWRRHKARRSVRSTVKDDSYDAIVIGTGPGGEGAAMQARKLGRSVAVVERMRSIGGACTHLGTIPSKALRFAISQAVNLHHSGLVESEALGEARSLPNLRSSAASVISKQVEMRRGFYERNGIPVFHGEARFAAPKTIEILDDLGGRRILKADAVIVATGARPYRPDDVD